MGNSVFKVPQNILSSILFRFHQLIYCNPLQNSSFMKKWKQSLINLSKKKFQTGNIPNFLAIMSQIFISRIVSAKWKENCLNAIPKTKVYKHLNLCIVIRSYRWQYLRMFGDLVLNHHRPSPMTSWSSGPLEFAGELLIWVTTLAFDDEVNRLSVFILVEPPVVSLMKLLVSLNGRSVR